MITSPEEFRDRVFTLAQSEDDPYKVTRTALAELTSPAEWRIVAELTAGPWVANLLRTNLPPATPVHRPRTFQDDEGNPRASKKEVDFLTWWQRRCAVKIRTVTGDKPLGQCTADDLAWIADYREKKAQEDMAAAARYRKLRDAMLDAGVSTVADVDEETGRGILEG